MSKSTNETEAAASPYDVVIVKSSATLNFEEDIPPERVKCFTKTVQLEKFPGAYWTVTAECYKYAREPGFNVTVSLLLEIFNFPVELQKDYFTEYEVSFNDCSNQTMSVQTAFEPSFKSATYFLNSKASFTANLIISKKTPFRSVEFLRNSLLDHVVNMFEEEAFSDFTFIVKDKQFKVHKLILAASSAVMKRMFTADYKEKETGECEIVDIEPHIFEALICFMYRYEVPKNLSSIAYELFEAAHYYDVENLKEACLNAIHKALSSENAIKYYTLAFKYDLKNLAEDSWNIIKRDILVIFNEKVKPMPPEEVENIMAIREKKQAEILKLQTEILAKQKKIEAEKLEFLRKEQAILENYTGAESDEPKLKKT